MTLEAIVLLFVLQGAYNGATEVDCQPPERKIADRPLTSAS